MSDPETRAALAFTLREIADHLDSMPGPTSRYEAGLLQSACVPLLDVIGSPYAAPDLDDRDAEQFSLRREPASGRSLPPLQRTVAQTLTDATDYLLHLSEGGRRNFAMENYLTNQSLALLGRIGAASAPGHPIG